MGELIQFPGNQPEPKPEEADPNIHIVLIGDAAGAYSRLAETLDIDPEQVMQRALGLLKLASDSREVGSDLVLVSKTRILRKQKVETIRWDVPEEY